MIKIVTDSACDLQSISQFAPGIAFSRVPLKILVGEKEFVDEPQLDVEQMMAEMYAFHGPSSSACPSPEDWARAFRDADEVYAITISGNISGSYSSAVAARQMVLEENPEKKIFLLNSFSAGAEMTLLVR